MTLNVANIEKNATKGFMKKPALALILQALSASTGYAENTNPKNAYIIEKFDQNGDHIVTKDEFLESAVQRFKMMDIDGDHAIEEREFMQRYAEHAHTTTHESAENVEKRVFEKLDENHDGKISEQEYNSSRLKWFSEADKNNDQQIELGK
jgi:Ca2+-binding EF-hand superfamily protein